MLGSLTKTETLFVIVAGSIIGLFWPPLLLFVALVAGCALFDTIKANKKKAREDDAAALFDVKWGALLIDHLEEAQECDAELEARAGRIYGDDPANARIRAQWLTAQKA